VIAVDIFRERVFLRNEEQGSRIIPLTQLRLEVEQLGDVLPTAEERSRHSVRTADHAPPADPSKSPSDSHRQGRHSRGRRGDGPDAPS
jgi:hypothetical protein